MKPLLKPATMKELELLETRGGSQGTLAGAILELQQALEGKSVIPAPLAGATITVKVPTKTETDKPNQ